MKHKFRNLLDSYINGNLSQVREEIKENNYNLGDIMEYYVEDYNADINDCILLAKRLG